MKIEIESLGVLSIDFEYIRIPLTVTTSYNNGPAFTRTIGCKLKTICTMKVGEIEVRWHVWKASHHADGFNLKEERKRALSATLQLFFPSKSSTSPTAYALNYEPNRAKRRAIWAALHASGFHPFPVSRVDRLTKMLEAAKKKAKRRAEKAVA